MQTPASKRNEEGLDFCARRTLPGKKQTNEAIVGSHKVKEEAGQGEGGIQVQAMQGR